MKDHKNWDLGENAAFVTSFQMEEYHKAVMGTLTAFEGLLKKFEKRLKSLEEAVADDEEVARPRLGLGGQGMSHPEWIKDAADGIKRFVTRRTEGFCTADVADYADIIRANYEPPEGELRLSAVQPTLDQAIAALESAGYQVKEMHE